MNGTSSQNMADPRATASSRLASLRRFLAAEPDNASLRRDVVATAVAAGEFDYVRELAEQRLANAPADPEAQFDRATALMGLKDFAGALQALEQLDTTIPGVRFNIGLCLFMQDRFADARPYFSAGYEAGERSAGQLRCFIRTMHHLGEIDAAMVVAGENASLVASDADLAGVCALLAIDANDIAGGKRYAQLALTVNPNNVDALVAAGSLYAAELDVANARTAFERTIAVQAENGRAWLGLGLLAMTDGHIADAIPQLERGIAAMPGHIGSWHSLGWAHLFTGNLDAAEKVFQHSLELNHNFSESHGSLAVIAAMRGDRATAQRLIEVAERLDRACMSSKYATSLLASSPEEGRRMLANLIEKVPGQGPRFAALLRRANQNSGKAP